MEAPKLISLDLSLVSEEVIEIFLLDDTAEPSLLEEIARKNTHRPDVLRRLLNHPKTPESTKKFVAEALQVPVPLVTAEKISTDVPYEKIKQQRSQSLHLKIQKLKIGERIQLAHRGSREIRSILLRDPNREVMLTVLENPKITDTEIEIIAKQKTTPDEVIRKIAKKREWLKNYSIVHALVTNSKTPISISLQYIKHLRIRDLTFIVKDKNVAGAVREAAKRIAAKRKSI
ncbi:MAG: hypothetical protein KAJ34_06150 [Thermodesulfovibrionia bacterium]|nr:hypothetical protein [Thermodesulfovibrionia bacterium]